MTDFEISMSFKNCLKRALVDPAASNGVVALLRSFPDLLIPILESELSRPRESWLEPILLVKRLIDIQEPPVPESTLKRVVVNLIMRSPGAKANVAEIFKQLPQLARYLTNLEHAPHSLDLPVADEKTLIGLPSGEVHPTLTKRWASLIDELNATHRQVQLLKSLIT